ncbi:MAG: DUF418 domain-containing protein [Bacteroidota bacterium]
MNSLSLQPTALEERFEILDVLRGFALLGVMIANMAYHSGYWFLSPENQEALGLHDFGEAIVWIIHLITEGKFYSIFSLLFGIGFGLQIQRSMKKGLPFTGRFSRRLLILLLFGILHAIFLFVGDILIAYALLGFILIFFRKSSNKTLLRFAFLLPIIPVIQYLVLWLRADPGTASNDLAGSEMFEQIVLTYQNGSVGEIFMTNTFGYVFGRFPDLIFTGRFFKVLAMFLLGFYVAKNNWISEISKRKHQLKRIMLYAAAIGIPCNIIMAQMMTTDAYYAMTSAGIIEPIVYAFGVPALGVSYACAVTLAYQTKRLKAILKALAPLGRMALTNYLMQSLICCLIFSSYGLGLFGKVSPPYFTLIGISILIAQTTFSKWWLSNYRYGPAEWLWRSATYKKVQQFRLAKPQLHELT